MSEAHQVVVQNVLSAQNALMTKLATIKSVLIHALMCVVKMPNAELTIIVPFAIVWKVTLVMLSLDAIFNLVRFPFA